MSSGYDPFALGQALQQRQQVGEYVPYAYPGTGVNPVLSPATGPGAMPVTPGQMPVPQGSPGFSPEVHQGARSPAIAVPNFAIPWIQLFQHKAGFGKILELYGDTFSPFWYSLGPLTLAIGGTLTNQPITMNTDSIFLCTNLLFKTSLTAAQVLDSTLFWRLSGSGANLMDQAVPIEQICWVSGSVFGNDQGTKVPFNRPVAILGGNTVVFDFTDIASPAIQTMFLTMEGYKFYKGSRPGQ